jgi:hypothetical protein
MAKRKPSTGLKWDARHDPWFRDREDQRAASERRAREEAERERERVEPVEVDQ